MTLHEYVAAYCPDGAAELKRLIELRTGAQLRYTQVYRWCRLDKPCALSIESATLVHSATKGKCTLDELQNRKTIMARIPAILASQGQRVVATAPPSDVASPSKRRSTGETRLLKRIADLERQVAELRQLVAPAASSNCA